MNKRVYKIPEFKNDAQAAAFWDTHDSTKFLSQTKPARLKFPKPRHKLVIDLEEKQWKILQYLAQRRKMSFSRLAEKLVEERLVASR